MKKIGKILGILSLLVISAVFYACSSSSSDGGDDNSDENALSVWINFKNLADPTDKSNETIIFFDDGSVNFYRGDYHSATAIRGSKYSGDTTQDGDIRIKLVDSSSNSSEDVIASISADSLKFYDKNGKDEFKTFNTGNFVGFDFNRDFKKLKD